MLACSPFIYFLYYQFLSQQVIIRIGGRDKNKINSDHFSIELKLKFPSILIQFEKMVRINFIFILPLKMAISHQVLSLGVI